MTRVLARQEDALERYEAAGGPGATGGPALPCSSWVSRPPSCRYRPTASPAASGSSSRSPRAWSTAGRAAPRRARGPPRQRGPRARRAARTALRGCDRRRLTRPLPPGRDCRPDRIARPRPDPALGRELLGIHARARARAAAAAAGLCDSAEGDRAPRGGNRALQALGLRGSPTSATSARPTTSNGRSTAWSNLDRPVLERRKIALQLRPTTRGGQRVFSLRSVGVEFGEDTVLAGVDLEVVHGERMASSAGTAPASPCC